MQGANKRSAPDAFYFVGWATRRLGCPRGLRITTFNNFKFVEAAWAQKACPPYLADPMIRRDFVISEALRDACGALTH